MTANAQTNTKRTVKLEIRCLPEEKQRMQAIASARGTGFDISKIVRERFPEAFGTNTPVRGRRSAPVATGGHEGTVDLAIWLAERTGAPRALMKLAIHEGRVSFDGGETVVFGEMVRESDLSRSVELDGERVG